MQLNQIHNLLHDPNKNNENVKKQYAKLNKEGLENIPVFPLDSIFILKLVMSKILRIFI